MEVICISINIWSWTGSELPPPMSEPKWKVSLDFDQAEQLTGKRVLLHERTSFKLLSDHIYFTLTTRNLRTRQKNEELFIFDAFSDDRKLSHVPFQFNPRILKFLVIGSKFIIALTPHADCLMIAVFSSAGKLVGDRVIPSQGLVCVLDADWCDGFTRY